MDKQIRPFGMRDKIGYMFGDFGNDFTFILSSAFMLKFYTDVMDMNRVASITLLKDATAKALYGSKGANGDI